MNISLQKILNITTKVYYAVMKALGHEIENGKSMIVDEITYYVLAENHRYKLCKIDEHIRYLLLIFFNCFPLILNHSTFVKSDSVEEKRRVLYIKKIM